MSMSLSSKIEFQIDQIMEIGDYKSAEDVMQRALDLLSDLERQHRLRTALAEAQADMEGGRVDEMTPELLARINAEAEHLYRRGVKPSPDVRP
ncbi:MAG: hypothetical protein ACR2OU_18435 [Thermomicrobiales bacterium]